MKSIWLTEENKMQNISGPLKEAAEIFFKEDALLYGCAGFLAAPDT